MESPPFKIVNGSTYLHVDGLVYLNDQEASLVQEAEKIAQVLRNSDYNLLRIDDTKETIAFLRYLDYDSDPFPQLNDSWLVKVNDSSVSYRTYSDSLNRPILHRKELLMLPSDPRRERAIELTNAAESIGLFDDTKRIGYQRQWMALIHEKGYRLDGYSLVPLGNNDCEKGEGELEPVYTAWNASRHLTAMVRYGFSAPIQSLARQGLLDGQYAVFDYGCGRGDDIRGLIENGISASGWDPYYAPDNKKVSAPLVNLGFVINVIEDYEERVDALLGAWSLTDKLLVISVMLSNQNDPRGQKYGDGIITTRRTFQKYYTQAEVKGFVEHVLDEEPIPVAPGVLYVFRDKDLEQRFQMNRYRSRNNRLRNPLPQQKEHRERAKKNRAELLYQEYKDPLNKLWDIWQLLGRKPQKDEVEELTKLLEGFGTLNRALRFLTNRNGLDAIECAERKRIEDLDVYFALKQFEHRRSYKHLELGLQRDIKAFFGSHSAAQRQSLDLLFSISDIDALDAACQFASDHGLGWLEKGKSLQLHASLVEQLPPLLRVYLGCAATIYGDYRNADLVKIHIHSGKVSLMRYDEFDSSPLPRMIERVKIKLREQDIEYFIYGEEYEPPFLYHKSRYINEEFADYPQQFAFDEALDDLGILGLSGYGPRPSELLWKLQEYRLEVSGYELIRSTVLPSPDEPCGKYLTYRDLIECGETQKITKIPNLPKQPDSYNALYDIAVNVLDPIIDYYGMIELTYGFCSPELARKIPGNIYPKLDQHAAHEINRKRNIICDRLGAAVDFLVEDENMLEVAQWVVENISFDRLYYYGPDKPIHVSYGAEHNQMIVLMKETDSGRRVPRKVSIKSFLNSEILA
ncbi:DNA phosphorothioation-associated putative methyltransferase [Sedimenticola selenatireducens]|uniref:DNA phosphorothioation-associated putative methyltransferase n=1 Tax=Sedimenticola selenatireducens TaxID=191960 RepID=UPI002AABB0A2|nr:DNA phosphorothioation-associated putative methyltransferase [Sedimenticola selenatireducens]